MLPKNHIGKPNAEHWSGLIDGVYAIALTLLALEIPKYMEALSELRAKGIAYEGMAIYLFLFDTLTYGAVFFILYEVWSFHRAVICIGKMNSKGQTFTNALILAGSSFIPAGVAFYLSTQIKKMLSITITEGNIITKLGSIYGYKDLGNSGFLFLYCIIFILLANLAQRSVHYNEYREMQMIKKECDKRAIVFTCLMATYGISILISKTPIPSIALLAFYVIYAYLDYDNKRRSNSRASYQTKIPPQSHKI